MPWATVNDVKQVVADHIARDGSLAYSDTDPRALGLRWERIVTRSLARAIADLSNVILGKTYTPEQLAAWDDAFQYSLDQAFYFAIIEGASPDDQSDRDVGRFDRVKFLMKLDDPLSLRINGVMVTPGNVSDGAAMAGGDVQFGPDGVRYGDLFGLKRQRQDGGLNQYGDQMSGWEW